MKNTIKLLIAVAIPVLIGFTASMFTRPEIPGWYATLNKPSWNPPSWLFAPVWTTLYILMGIALWLVWKAEAPAKDKRIAYGLFAAQLVLNFFWSFIFFRMHETGWALVEIIIMWNLILLTILAFARFSSLASWLMVPYISWVSFATILNYTIWKLNG